MMDIREIIQGMPQTEKEYWKDPELAESEATVLRVVKDKGNHYLVTDKTVFYPQGGDQAGDKGQITSQAGRMEVKKIFISGGVILHYGKVEGIIGEGEKVEMKIDLERRVVNTKMHSLGHLVGSCVWALRPELPSPDSQMARPGWINILGDLSDEEISKVKEMTNKAIAEDQKTTIRFVSLEELKRICKHLPDKLPSQNLRIVQQGDFEPIPCGGTHVGSLGVLKGLRMLELKPSEKPGEKLLWFDFED